jgi:hypothetical protein
LSEGTAVARITNEIRVFYIFHTTKVADMNLHIHGKQPSIVTNPLIIKFKTSIFKNEGFYL